MSDPTAQNQPERPPAATITQRPLREQKWVIVMAACIAGVMIGYGLAGFAPKEPDWKRDAAQHHSLYRGWSVVSLSPAVAELAHDFAIASKALGTELHLSALSSQGTLTIKRVQILGVRDSKLVQLLYAAPGGTPVALYVISRRSPAVWSPPEMVIQQQMRAGLATATWSSETADFMLIGGGNLIGVAALADGLSRKINLAGRS